MAQPNLQVVPNIIDVYANAYNEAKAEFNEAKSKMDNAFQCLIQAVGVKDEGTQSFNTDNYKISTTGKINRTVDAKKVEEIAQQLPEPLYNRLFKFKPSLDLKEYRYIENNEPQYHKIVSRAVTAKPAKPTLKIEAQ